MCQLHLFLKKIMWTLLFEFVGACGYYQKLVQINNLIPFLNKNCQTYVEAHTQTTLKHYLYNLLLLSSALGECRRYVHSGLERQTKPVQ